MDIKITSFNINNAQKSYRVQTAKTQTIHTQNISNPVLPNYKNYFTNITFGKKGIEMSPEAFMLPKNCVPDQYQIAAANHLQRGAHTIVTAPTGTGKTAIAHYIIKKNFEEGKKTFYTTPLKALSNQKYHDLKKLFGKENIGILTGDRKENIHAPIVIMTTEIYHNMVTSNYFGKHNDMLKNVKTVVFDEFHYMGDPARGHVWEESIMFTPSNTQILALSATVGNNTKIEKWIKNITGKPTKLVDVPIEARHVPLRFSYLNNGKMQETESSTFDIKALETAFNQRKLLDKQSKVLGVLAEGMGYRNDNKGQKRAITVLKDQFGKGKVSDNDVALFLKEEYNMRKEATDVIISTLSLKKPKSINNATSIVATNTNSRPEPKVVLNLIRQLDKEDKLPAIAFVFSKQYADKLLKAATISGKDLTTFEEKLEIQKHINEYVEEHGLYSNNLNENALLKGYAIHSAAVLPLQKQLIEELFNKKLLKVAFATETLAAGINMPAKTVIMTDYKKPSGETKSVLNKHEFLRNLMPNEFHQMTGRAGRRGIDTVGHVILIAQDDAAQNIFEQLRLSKPNNVESAYKTDASSVTGFLSNSHDIKGMRYILEKSFFATAQEDKTEQKIDGHMRTINNYLSLLMEYGFAEKANDGHKLTASGQLISDIKGKPQIPIVKALLEGRLAHLTPVELAGLISSIVVQPKITSYPIPPLPLYSNQDTSEKALNEINNKISDKLKNDLKLNNIDANSTSQKIMFEIQKAYGDILREDFDQLSNTLDSLKKDIELEERQLNRDSKYVISNNYRTLTKLQKNAKETKYKLTMIKRINYVRELLNSRASLSMSLSAALEDGAIVRNNAYNELATEFNKYNDSAAKLSAHLPKADLNPLVFNLIYKWASVNNNSKDHKANWDYMCRFLNEFGAIKYEGELFNAIAQTIDFIHQLEDVVAHAQSIRGLAHQTQDFTALKSNLKAAAKLLKQPPLYSECEI